MFSTDYIITLHSIKQNKCSDGWTEPAGFIDPKQLSGEVKTKGKAERSSQDLFVGGMGRENSKEVPAEYQDAPDCLCSRLRHRDCMAVTTGKFDLPLSYLPQKIRQILSSW